jgi:hypothetical protein
MFEVVANLAEENAYFGHISLFVRLVKVLPQRIGQWFLPHFERFEQTLQHPLSEVDIERYTTTK